MDLAISKLKKDIKELKQLGGYPRIKKRIESYQKAIDYLEARESQKAETSDKASINYKPLLSVVISDSEIEDYVNKQDTPEGLDVYTYDAGFIKGAKWLRDELSDNNA